MSIEGRKPYTRLLDDSTLRDQLRKQVKKAQATLVTLEEGGLAALQARGVALGSPSRTSDSLHTLRKRDLKTPVAQRMREVLFRDHGEMAAEGVLQENGILALTQVEEIEQPQNGYRKRTPRQESPEQVRSAEELLRQAGNRMQALRDQYEILGESKGLLGTFMGGDTAIIHNDKLSIFSRTERGQEPDAEIKLAQIADRSVNLRVIETEGKRKGKRPRLIERLIGPERGTIIAWDTVTGETFEFTNVPDPARVIREIGKAAREIEAAQDDMQDLVRQAMIMLKS